MELVRYGIIGMGNMGSAHLNNFMKEGNIPNARVVAIADLKPERIEAMLNAYP